MFAHLYSPLHILHSGGYDRILEYTSILHTLVVITSSGEGEKIKHAERNFNRKMRREFACVCGWVSKANNVQIEY